MLRILNSSSSRIALKRISACEDQRLVMSGHPVLFVFVIGPMINRLTHWKRAQNFLRGLSRSPCPAPLSSMSLARGNGRRRSSRLRDQC